MSHLFSFSGSLVVLTMGLLFAFSNGFRDSSTIVATVVSTRALSPAKAFAMCAFCQFVGAFLLGTAVTSTMRERFFPAMINGVTTKIILVLSASLLSAHFWGLVSWWRAWPTSTNHALVAALTGAGAGAWGLQQIRHSHLLPIYIVIVMSPVIGFTVSFLITRAMRFAGEWMMPAMSPIVDKLHVAVVFVVSLTHGSNDVQMILAVILMSFGIDGALPISLKLLTAGSMALGVLMGGRRILKRLGMSFYRIQGLQGLGAQVTAAATILTCVSHGFPLSTTHVITGSILGAGAAKNHKAIKWHNVLGVAFSWVITIPVVGALSYLLYMTGERMFLQ